MEDLEAFAGVFEPDEAVVITLNGETIFEGAFEDALPVLAGVELVEDDHLMVANGEVGPVAAIPNFYCPN